MSHDSWRLAAYRRDYGCFRSALYQPDHAQAVPMWLRLDELMGFEA